MKKILKYVCIAMIVIAGYNLIFESFLVFSGGFAGPAGATIPFIAHATMLITGIIGLKHRDNPEKQKMLAGISGMQTLLCLLAIFISYSLWIVLKPIGIIDTLSVICSVVLLVYYIRGAVKLKREEREFLNKR